MFAGQGGTSSVHSRHLSLHFFICLCVRGSPTGLILSKVLFLSSIPLPLIAAAGWIVVLSAFSMAECAALVSVCIWQETGWPALERRGEQRRAEERRGEEKREGFPLAAKMMIKLWMLDSPFPLSPCLVLLSGTHTPTHTLWGRLRNCLNTAHQLGINNSVILHCVDVKLYFTVGLTQKLCAILRSGALCYTSENCWEHYGEKHCGNFKR